VQAEEQELPRSGLAQELESACPQLKIPAKAALNPEIVSNKKGMAGKNRFDLKRVSYNCFKRLYEINPRHPIKNSRCG
jgi:hypothetical protein